MNPYQKDYYIKQFNDAFYFGGEKYKNTKDNFAYVRCRDSENRTSAILENILQFFMRYPEFHSRTGIGLTEFLMMDPSTSDMIKHTWAELMKPEEKKQEDMSKLQKQFNQLNKQMKGG